MHRENAQDETKALADYLKGFADANQNEKLSRAAEWLEKLSIRVCGQGYIGCSGGHDCGSDHK